MPEKITLPEGLSKEAAEKLLKQQPVVFIEIETGYLKKIIIWRNFYKGKELFGMQNFYKEDETQEEWKFGKAVNFPPENIDDVIEGFTKMKAFIDNEA